MRWIKSQECWGTEDARGRTVLFQVWLNIGMVELAMDKIGFHSWVVQTQALAFRSPRCQRATVIHWRGSCIEKGVTCPAVEKFTLKVCIMYLDFSVDFHHFSHFSLMCISESFKVSCINT